MYGDFYRQALFAMAVVGFFVLFVLAFALWWLRQSTRQLRTGAGGRAPVMAAGALALIALLVAIGFAVFATVGLPLFIEALEEQAAGTEQQQAMLDRPAPHLHFTGVADDRAYTLDEFAGEVVLVNFWGTWCRPCVKEMPDLERLQRDLEPRGLTVIHFSDEPRAKLNRYLEKKNPANLHVYADSTQWLALAVPTTYIVDREGVLRAFHVGSADYGVFAALVEPYL